MAARWPAGWVRSCTTPERLPKVLRDIYGDVKPHVVETHTHKWGMTITYDGIRQIVAIGCSRDSKRTRYKQDKSAFYQWGTGFGWIDADGYGMSLNLEHTNWKKWLHPHYWSLIPEDQS